jgi:hypothetical protein
MVVHQRIAALRQMGDAQREAYADELGFSTADIKRLLEPGGCGKLSEADLDRFAAAFPEMSVGFASAASGTLLAAQFLRYVFLGARTATEGGAMAIATFARAKLRLTRVGCDNSCDCHSVLRGRWSRLWQPLVSRVSQRDLSPALARLEAVVREGPPRNVGC